MALGLLLVLFALGLALMAMMTGFGGAALFAAATDALESGRKRRNARALRRVTAMAEATGLVALLSARPHQCLLAGVVDGFDVHVRWDRRWGTGATVDRWTCLTVGPVADGIALQPAPITPDPARLLVGGPAFETRVATTGQPSVAYALLDANARHVLAQELSRYRYRNRFYRMEVVNGWVQVQVQSHLKRASDLQALLARAVRVARALRGDDAPLLERLARNAQVDPDPDVRVRCLQTLIAHHPGHEAFKAAVWALDGSEPRATLLAALYLEQHDDAIHAVHRLLDGPLAGWGGPCGWHRVRPWTLYLARVACGLDHPGTASLLLRLLEAPSNEIRVLVLRGLARHGTVDTIEPLIDYLHRPFPRVRGAARDAIRSIQSRLEGAEAGLLSLADPPEQTGWLSLPEERSAAVS